MKRIFYLLIFTFILTICSQLTLKAQQFEWAKMYGHESLQEDLKGMCTGPDGNIYITGSYNTFLSFSPDTLRNGNIFIAKLDKDGKPLWAKDAVTSGSFTVVGITADMNNSIYVTGFFSGSITFNGQKYNSAGSFDIFIAKYNTSGSLSWVKTYGGTGSDAASAITTDALGNIYLTGNHNNNLTFGSTTLTSNGINEIFIAKFNSDGNPLWAKNSVMKRDPSYIYPNFVDVSVIADHQGNAILSFAFKRTEITIGGHTLKSNDINESVNRPFGIFNIAIIKFNATGNISWVKQGRGFASSTQFSIHNTWSGVHLKCAVAPGNEIYVVATSEPGSDYILFDKDSFFSTGLNVFKLSPGGDIIWKRIGGSLVVESYLRDFKTDKYGNLYILGHNLFPNGNPVEPYYMGEDTLWVQGNPYMFIFKMDTAGNSLYFKEAGARWGSNMAFAMGNAIAADNEGNTYIAGVFGHTGTAPRPIDMTVYFDSFSLTAPRTKFHQEMFVAKIQTCGDDKPIVTANNENLLASKTGSKYQWYFNGQMLHNDTLRSLVAKADGLYSVKVMQTNGCKAYSAAYNYKAPLPKVTARFTANNACAGKDVTFTNTSTGEVTPLTYNWDFGDGNTSTATNPVHRYTAAGTYNVRLIAIIPQQNSDTFTAVVTVFPAPSANFTNTATGKQLSFTPSDTSQLSYNWNFGDGNTSTAHSPKHTYTADGKYLVTLKVRNSNDCETEFSDSVTINTTGISTQQGPGISLNIFPNPFHEQAFVTYKLEKNAKVKISIFDMQGKEISVIAEASQTAGNYTYQLNADAHKMNTAGIYFVKIVLDDAVISRQIIRVK